MFRHGWLPGGDLEMRTRRQDPTARVMIDGRIEHPTQYDIRQRYDQFANGTPGLDSLPANTERLISGGVRLKSTGSVQLASTIITSATTYYHDKASALGVPYLDPIANDTFSRFGALVTWGGTESVDMQLSKVQLYLHPRYDLAQRKFVSKWRVRLYAIVQSTLFGYPALSTAWTLLQISSADADATGDVAGWVDFNFGDERPTPKRYGFDVRGYVPFTQDYRACLTLVTVEGIDVATAAPAANIGWGYDSGHIIANGSGSSALSSIEGRKFSWLDNRNSFGYRAPGDSPGVVVDSGTTATVPGLQFTVATHTSATIGYTGAGNQLDLGATPATPPELILRAETPAGTSVTGEISANGGANYYPYVDGQFVNTVGPGLATQQTYKIRWTLTTNAAGDAAPIFRAGGARVVVTSDVSDVVEVVSWSEGFDPVELIGEIPEARFRAIHDGERDYHDVITELLSQNPTGKMFFRVLTGDASLAKSLWLHRGDFLIEDHDPGPASVDIVGVGVMALVRQGLPKLTSEVSAYPSADDSNPGVWTASAGSILWASLADGQAGADLTTYIVAPNNPASDKDYTANLTAISTPTLPGGGAQLVGIELQYFYALTTGVGPDTLQVDLFEGAVSRASRSDAVILADPNYTLGRLILTEAQIQSITNWGTLKARFRAKSGTGQIRVAWCRLVVLPLRRTLLFNSQTPAAAATELIANQIDLDDRYRGDPIVDDPALSLALSVGRTVTDASGGSTDLTMGKQLLDGLANIAGGVWVEMQGKMFFVRLFDITYDATNVRYRYSTKLPIPAVTIFSSEIAEPISCSPGLRQRVPEYDVPWGYQEPNGPYTGEAHGVSAVALTNLRSATIDPPRRAREAVARWLNSEAIAKGLANRQVDALGMGLLQWRFRSIMAYPELRLGDVIAVQTDRFIAFDPSGNRSLRGMVWATGIVCGIYDVWGRDLAIWIPSYQNIALAGPTPAGSPPAPPLSGVTVQARWGMAAATTPGQDYLAVFYDGAAGVRSAKVATSTSSQPASGTGTLVVGQNGQIQTGPFAYATTVYVTITPYADDAGALPGEPRYAVAKLDSSGSSTGWNGQGSTIPTTTLDGLFTYSANGGAGAGVSWISYGYGNLFDGSGRGTIRRPDGTTVVPSYTESSPTAPTCSEVVGGALGARTYWVYVARKKNGGTYALSSATSFAVAANKLLKVTGIPSVAGFDGYTVFLSIVSGSDDPYDQRAPVGSEIPFGTDWTEPTSGIDTTKTIAKIYSGAAGERWRLITFEGLDPSTTYIMYPYYDPMIGDGSNYPQVAFGRNRFGIPTSTGYDPNAAQEQFGDRHIPLTDGAVVIATPAAATSSSSSSVGYGPHLYPPV